MTSNTTSDRHRRRGHSTREAILDAAERLFAEHGLDNVSHRQITAAAGQGNNAAVSYHFGTTAEVLRAVVRRHAVAEEALRQRLLAEVEGSTDIRDWVRCLVQPVAEHLERLGSPTWYARLRAQLTTDPHYRETIVDAALESDTMRRTTEGFWACVPQMASAARSERAEMARLLLVHVLAERECALAHGLPTPRTSWLDCADGLTDALVGLWLAPVTSPL